MARPERRLNAQAGPVQAFAAELRLAREKAGSPKYLQMARMTGRSRTALAEAAGGDHLPTWETVTAYLNACGQDPADWHSRWTAVRIELDTTTRSTTSPTQTPATQTAAPPPHRALALRMLGATGAAVVIVLVTLAIAGHSAGKTPTGPPVDTPTGPVIVIVQNKVAIGPSSLTEDITPVYLSSKTLPACSHNNCEVPDTQMWSGAVLQATCQQQGTLMTNADSSSPGIAGNPGAATSTRWYRVEIPTGVTGYISEVYLTPTSRGGRGLPAC